MHLVKTPTKTDPVNQKEAYIDVCSLKQTGYVIKPEQIIAGGYYIYKEKYGMVSLVKVLKTTVYNDWIGFRLMVKQVLYSPWAVNKGIVFEVGCNVRLNQASWHFEPGMSLVKCATRIEDNIDFADDIIVYC